MLAPTAPPLSIRSASCSAARRAVFAPAAASMPTAGAVRSGGSGTCDAALGRRSVLAQPAAAPTASKVAIAAIEACCLMRHLLGTRGTSLPAASLRASPGVAAQGLLGQVLT